MNPLIVEFGFLGFFVAWIVFPLDASQERIGLAGWNAEVSLKNLVGVLSHADRSFQESRGILRHILIPSTPLAHNAKEFVMAKTMAIAENRLRIE